jgi:hypothetical protein
MTDLQPFKGDFHSDSYSAAVAINDRGGGAGISIDANFNLRAVVWQHGVAKDLSSLGVTQLYMQTACSINASGEIVGIAFDRATGEFHAYKAIPQAPDAD